MTLGLLDLSIVTDRLLKHLSDSEAASRLWDEEPTPPLGPTEPTGIARATAQPKFAINFTGLAPDAVRELSGCSLSLYLFHVSPDKFHRNTFPLQDLVGVPPLQRLVAPHARTIPQQPLALTLYYLLHVHSANYIEEQQAMSIALKCFHDHPIVTATVPMSAPAPSRTEEFTLTMEPESVDEIGRLWQSMSTPLRLSAVYRASVIFLEPEASPPDKRQLVQRPEVKAYPEFAITRAAVDPTTRLATITGSGFVSESIVVRVDNTEIHVAAAGQLGDNTFRVESSTKLLIQLPLPTRQGRHRLGVQLDPGQPEALFTLEVPP